MKKFWPVVAVTAAFGLLVLLAISDADARGRSGGGRGHTAGARSHSGGAHVHHRRSAVGHVARVPIVVASPRWYYSPGYYYGHDPYYYPLAAYAPEQDVVFVEQAAPDPLPSARAQADSYWYYCTDSNTYFPYVQTCATPWQRVVPYAPQ